MPLWITIRGGDEEEFVAELHSAVEYYHHEQDAPATAHVTQVVQLPAALVDQLKRLMDSGREEVKGVSRRAAIRSEAISASRVDAKQ